MRQVALVTGSSRGIGLGATIELARQGLAVAVNGPDDDAELVRAVESVAREDQPVIAMPFDVTDISGHAARFARIEAELGPLTTLVNNAGVGVIRRGDPLDVTEQIFDRCLAVNAKAMFFLSQAFARRLVARDRPKDLFFPSSTSPGPMPWPWRNRARKTRPPRMPPPWCPRPLRFGWGARASTSTMCNRASSRPT